MPVATLATGVKTLHTDAYADALGTLHSALTATPRNPRLWHSAASVAARLGRLPDALHFFQRGLELDPNSADMWSGCGAVLNAAGQFSAALDALRRAAALDPAKSATHAQKGIAESALNLHWMSIASLSRALMFDPNDSVAKAQLEAEWQRPPRFPHSALAPRITENAFATPRARRPILFVSLTRGRKEDTELYHSLSQLGIDAFEFVEFNSRGIPESYNRFLDRHVGRDLLIVFAHDDLTISDPFVLEKLTEASGWFNLMGVAGSAEFHDRGQPRLSWRFASDTEFLSGSVHHEPRGRGGFWATFGNAPQECVTLDGLFLAVDMLHIGDLRFDERFQFHFYDLDFCVSANRRGLAAGTTDVMVSHRSLGDLTTADYAAANRTFRGKWREAVSMSVLSNRTRDTARAPLAVDR